MQTNMQALDRAIEYFGGQHRGGSRKLAEAMGLKKMAVTHWKRRGFIPAERCADIERVTNGEVTRADLRPELFGDVCA